MIEKPEVGMLVHLISGSPILVVTSWQTVTGSKSFIEITASWVDDRLRPCRMTAPAACFNEMPIPAEPAHKEPDQ